MGKAGQTEPIPWDTELCSTNADGGKPSQALGTDSFLPLTKMYTEQHRIGSLFFTVCQLVVGN